MHVALIMDGNRRWAKAKNRSSVFGHRAGIQALEHIVRACPDLGIHTLTLFAFSTENWHRSQREIYGLTRLLQRGVVSYAQQLQDNHVNIKILGDITAFPPGLQHALHTLPSCATPKLTLRIALNYGGRQDIVRAAQALACQVQKGTLNPVDITDTLFQHTLYDGNTPDPDILIRTSGEVRLSNYILWSLAYTELFFTPVLWPDFTPNTLETILHQFSQRKRRFGGSTP